MLIVYLCFTEQEYCLKHTCIMYLIFYGIRENFYGEWPIYRSLMQSFIGIYRVTFTSVALRYIEAVRSH